MKSDSLILSIYSNDKRKKDQMSQYLTPLKESNQNQPRPTKHMSQPREGDWVCLSCHNLNFSFRKKCNRCKVQTRQHNEQVSAFYLNYYPKEYYYPDENDCYPHPHIAHSPEEKENFPTIHPYPSAHPAQSILHQLSPSRKDHRTPQKTKKPREELPSVSPLLKRYNRNDNQSTHESKNQGLFEDESIWANIDINYLEEPSEDNILNNDMEEIERIIHNIML